MPVTPEVALLLAESPEALAALSQIADRERRAHLPVGSLSGMGGVISRDMVKESSLGRARAAIAAEHERVLCSRDGQELDADIDPTPDPLARHFLHLIGLVDASEVLPLETEN